jgi:hypothetical protein
MSAARLFGILVFGAAIASAVPIVDPFYAASYSLVNLGTPPGVPGSLGGLTLQSNNNLFIGGAANGGSGAVYSIGVTRAAGDNSINGFVGSGALVSTAAGLGSGGIDGGLAFGPGGVLFYTSYPDNSIGQIKPGSATPDKQIALSGLGLGSSVGTLNFIPAGFGGAGRMIVGSYGSGNWYSFALSPDGSGTFDLTSMITGPNTGGGPEGIIYVPIGSSLFANPSVLVSEYSVGVVASYEVDANGFPIPATRRVFISGLGGAEGAFLDALTGDFLFSTFGSGNEVIRVDGFAAAPPPGVPEPASISFVVLGLGAFALLYRRRTASAR